MFSKTWARHLTGAAILAIAATPALAASVTVDFENAFTAVGPGQVEPSYTDQGYRFTPTGGDAEIGPSFCGAPDFCAVGNNTSYLSALNDAEVTVTRTDGGTFSLLSFAASFLPSPALDYTGLDIRLALIGIGAGGNASQSVDLLGDGAGNFVFNSYAVDPSLRNVSSLTFSACFFDGTSCVRASGLATNDAQFSIDDLSFVPEPSAAWLVALSLAGLALTRRRAAR